MGKGKPTSSSRGWEMLCPAIEMRWKLCFPCLLSVSADLAGLAWRLKTKAKQGPL